MEAKNLKAQGVTPGIPDVFIAIPDSDGCHGLFIEFKSKNGTLSTIQETVIKRLMDKNYVCLLCKNLDDAIKGVQDYLGELYYVR